MDRRKHNSMEILKAGKQIEQERIWQIRKRLNPKAYEQAVKLPDFTPKKKKKKITKMPNELEVVSTSGSGRGHVVKRPKQEALV